MIEQMTESNSDDSIEASELHETDLNDELSDE